jgi:hypothetical protein
MNNNHFAIYNINDPSLLWSNTYGWVDDDDSFDLFTIEESETLNLPLEGQWVRFNDVVKNY